MSLVDSGIGSIPPGWYPDPAGEGGNRWWDGTKWTNHLQSAAAVGGSEGTRTVTDYSSTFPGTTAQRLSYTLQLRIYTPQVWAVALQPLWGILVFLIALVSLGNTLNPFVIVFSAFVVFLAGAILIASDRRVLLTSGHTTAASAWWVLLTPLLYLIARGVHVTRNTGHGWAPAALYLVCSVGLGVAWAVLPLVQSMLPEYLG